MGCYAFSFGMKGNNSTKAYNFLDLAQLFLNFPVKVSDFSFGLQGHDYTDCFPVGLLDLAFRVVCA